MDWKDLKSRFSWKMSKDKWIILLVIGAIFMILSFPDNKKKTTKFSATENADLTQQFIQEQTDQRGYEKYLEERVKEILSQVEGVGKVDVMVVLKASEEKVYRIDRNTSSSSTDEEDASGGTRKIQSREASEQTVLQNSSGNTQPVITKEIKPTIAGIVISASGGGSPKIKAEISSAMEALFDVPAHKIKVLKRVE